MKTLDGQWSTDTIDSNCGKSLDGNRYAQVFSNKNYYAKVYPIESKDKAGDALHQFCNDVGVPKELIFDGSREQCKKNTKFMQTVRKYGINYHILEPHYHNQNPVEGVVRELRQKWYCTNGLESSSQETMGLWNCLGIRNSFNDTYFCWK